MSEGEGKPKLVEHVKAGNAACFRAPPCPKCKRGRMRMSATVRTDDADYVYRRCTICGFKNGGKVIKSL